VTRFRARRQLAFAGAAGWLLAAWRGAHAQAQGLGLVRESAVKAAFLYKFGSFVEYPPGAFAGPKAPAPFVIGVFGDDAIASELEQLTAGREIDGHPATVVRIRDGEESPLHILYAGGPRENRAREVLALARGPVLTVADGPLGGKSPPVLYFTQDQGRLRFGASLPAAASRGLKLSSKLLAVAQAVEGR
jgi:hypothetical protein